MTPMTDYYVYYKVPAEHVASFLPVAVAMQSDVYRLSGIRGRLKKKSSDELTWMEIYEGVHQRLLFEGALADCVARFGIEQYLAASSQRKSEVFHDPLA